MKKQLFGSGDDWRLQISFLAFAPAHRGTRRGGRAVLGSAGPSHSHWWGGVGWGRGRLELHHPFSKPALPRHLDGWNWNGSVWCFRHSAIASSSMTRCPLFSTVNLLRQRR